MAKIAYKYKRTKMTYDDITVIIGLNEGNHKAYKWIYDTYYPKLCAYAKSILKKGNARLEEAEDIVHDVFLYLWKDRETIKITESLSSYLNACVRYQCFNHFKRVEVLRKYIEYFLNENIEPHDHNNPEQVAIAKETESIIKNAINALPDKCREIFLLRWNDGLKYDEIAEKLGIAIGTVKGQIARARIFLLKSLDE